MHVDEHVPIFSHFWEHRHIFLFNINVLPLQLINSNYLYTIMYTCRSTCQWVLSGTKIHVWSFRTMSSTCVHAWRFCFVRYYSSAFSEIGRCVNFPDKYPSPIYHGDSGMVQTICLAFRIDILLVSALNYDRNGRVANQPNCTLELYIVLCGPARRKPAYPSNCQDRSRVWVRYKNSRVWVLPGSNDLKLNSYNWILVCFAYEL